MAENDLIREQRKKKFLEKLNQKNRGVSVSSMNELSNKMEGVSLNSSIRSSINANYSYANMPKMPNMDEMKNISSNNVFNNNKVPNNNNNNFSQILNNSNQGLHQEYKMENNNNNFNQSFNTNKEPNNYYLNKYEKLNKYQRINKLIDLFKKILIIFACIFHCINYDVLNRIRFIYSVIIIEITAFYSKYRVNIIIKNIVPQNDLLNLNDENNQNENLIDKILFQINNFAFLDRWYTIIAFIFDIFKDYCIIFIINICYFLYDSYNNKIINMI